MRSDVSNRKAWSWISAGLLVIALAVLPLSAKVTNREVTLNVMLQGAKSLPPLQASNFVVTDNGQLQNVEVVAGPSNPTPLYVAVALENGVAASANNQLGNLKQFIMALPQGTNVLVAKIDRNHATVTVPFTTDRSRTARAVSILADVPSEVPLNTFVSVSELLNNFKGLEGRKELVLIGSGFDILQDELTPTNNSDLQQAENKARDLNVAVHTIWIPSAAGRSPRLDLSGASNMQDVATATGGLSFWNVDRRVVLNLETWLDTLRAAFNQQYVLRFSPDLAPGQRHRIKVQLRDVQESKLIKVNFPKR
ncbi:MAG: hypothetical protein PHX83_04910 [Acidobacteriia bacterium]|nr:hypothetical protein [Terriglobia bacterium]